MNEHTRQFTRLFRIVERLFPGAQMGFPSEVANSVQPIVDVFKPSFMHVVRLRSEIVTTATGGVDTVFQHLEPSAGFIHMPILHTVSYDGAVNANAVLGLRVTTSQVDPWGRWTESDADLYNVRVGSSREIQVPSVPYSRGTRLSIRMSAPAAATNFTCLLLFLEIPGELCSLETWHPSLTNFVHTVALP